MVSRPVKNNVVTRVGYVPTLCGPSRSTGEDPSDKATKAMPPTRTVDVKLLFDPYDCHPGRADFEKFSQNLRNHGGTTDDHGWSLADCLMRQDDGAVDIAGAPIPGVGLLQWT